MASTYNELGIELMATGENAGTWGDKTNSNLNLIQQAIAGYQSVTVNGTGATTLAMTDGTISNARNQILKLSGTITGNITVTVPNSIEKSYIVFNSTSGAHTVQFKTVSGTGPTFAATDKGTKLVYADGTNVVDTGFSSAGIDAVVDDTSPQLGGNLDANGNNILIDSGNFIGDENGLEQVKFTTTASAVNELTVVNAATTNPPQLQATGGDTNVDMNLVPKGLGRITLGAAKIIQTAEKITIAATGTTGTVNYDVITQAVLYHTAASAGNFTVNFRGDGSNTLNAIMDIGESITLAFLTTNTGSAYYNNVVKIDGSTVTPEWQGGSAPSSGNINSVDAYTYTIIKTADATFTSLAVQTQFA